MASLQERVNNRKFYKRVRRNGKWVTIDTRTNKIVDKATRLKHKSENKKKWIQRGKNREKAVGKWFKDNVTDRLFDSDEDDPNHPVKGGKLTQRQARLKYEKEVANRDTGKDDAEMNAQQQARALKISKKRDLTNIPVKDGLKVNKSENKDSSNKNSSNKNSSNKEKLKSGKMHSIEKKNREIHGDAAVDRLKQKHKEWKKARKEGKLDEWKKKWKKK
tara:strand:- start:1497 stop:2150 length:654 start_codon:yes stop_codon:yes gene_type:complete